MNNAFKIKLSARFLFHIFHMEYIAKTGAQKCYV